MVESSGSPLTVVIGGGAFSVTLLIPALTAPNQSLSTTDWETKL
jgi:hypothetical protein